MKTKYNWEDAFQECSSMIYKLASQLASKSPILGKDDLINLGMMGLWDAAQKYKKDKQTKFSTYAYIRIRGAMLDEIRKTQSHKRVTAQKMNSLDKVIQDNLLQFNQKLSNKDMSEATGLSCQEVSHLSQHSKVHKVSEHNNISYDDDSIEIVVELKERNRRIKKAIENLSDKEQTVIDLRFKEELRLKEIGNILNISETRAYQIQKKALETLKDDLDRDDIRRAA